MTILNEALRAQYNSKLATPEQAAAVVRSGDRVFVGLCSTIAYQLLNALTDRKDELEDVRILSTQFQRPSPVFQPEGVGHFRSCSFFIGPWERNAVSLDNGEFTSFHLSQSDLWVRDVGRPDVAFLEVSAPDENGYMSYGPSGIAIDACVKSFAKTVVLQVNPNVPYILGEDNLIHVSEPDLIVEAPDELATIGEVPVSPEIETISQLLVDEIPDGACIQLGLGGLANAVGYGLEQKNDLGVHSEMMTDSMMHLMKMGVITNARKSFMPGKAVASFALGSKELYRFLDHNPDLYFMPFTKVNDPCTIGLNDNMISVNTAMAIDLFGQVAADALGFHQQSACGGQIDFVRGAQRSKGGKSFIAMTSTGESKRLGRYSKIVSAFPPGTAVTTPRSDVQYVVTEYGCVNLKQLTMQGRVRAMIDLAHPDFRPQLRDEARAAGVL
ncbi:MAG: acetyl-CoA hydrolase [Oscillospiraceae bacterium]|nr:acetyl-CoA hydrolase [Oscillospiraceae bacterium]